MRCLRQARFPPEERTPATHTGLLRWNPIHGETLKKSVSCGPTSGIPTQDFEDHGWVYHMVEMNSEEQVGTDSRQITRTVTKSSDTDNMEKILRKLDATMDVTTEDGYAGTLRLDHTSVSVEAAGYATRNNSVSATRVYPDLNDADLSLIPKTIEDGGRTLTLDDVRWEEGWQTDAEGGFLRYSATANYVGTTSSRYATGYTVTANYTGEVSRSDVEMVTWKVTPPQPESSEQAEPYSPAETSGDNPETVVTEAGETGPASQASLASSDAGSSSDGTENAGETPGEAIQPIREPERPKTTPDYSGLKRTLLSCGLLIALAVAAYLVNKFKNQRGGNQNS